MDREHKAKYEKLKDILKYLESVAIAYSGGVDSTLLLKAASDALGGNVVAFTARSETYPELELQGALCMARELDVECRVIETSELEVECFADNPPERCYYCKSELFTKISNEAKKHGLKHVADGANADDVADFRPGLKAAAELGVRSPLKEAGLTKQDIRAISKELGLPTWNKPAYACLASRFPYGEKITEEKLKVVAAAENLLRELGFSGFRVRHHGTIARIEVPQQDMKRLLQDGVRQRVIKEFKNLGFTYVTVDIEGHRSGSMNEPLSEEQKRKMDF